MRYRNAIIATAALAIFSGPAVSRSEPSVREVAVMDVAFAVRNINRSLLPCPTDGRAYTIRGSLVAPVSVLSEPEPAVTLLIHGAVGGEWVFRPPVPELDFAGGLARRGNATVVVDRLGYDRSRTETAPHGFLSCMGAEADVASQIVAELRSGVYLADGRSGIPFTKVAVGGFSQGAMITMAEAFSFNDADAYIPMAWADATPKALKILSRIEAQCLRGGRPAEFDGSGPPGYAAPWQTAEAAVADVFHRPTPEHVALMEAFWNRDPCGTHGSGVIGNISNTALSGRVSKPVLLVYAEFDEIFDPASYEQYRDRYTGSDDVTLAIVQDAGHAFFAENADRAAESQDIVADWLTARGF